METMSIEQALLIECAVHIFNKITEGIKEFSNEEKRKLDSHFTQISYDECYEKGQAIDKVCKKMEREGVVFLVRVISTEKKGEENHAAV